MKALVHETVTVHSVRDKIRINPGKKVLEARLHGGWNIGKVVFMAFNKARICLEKQRYLSYILEMTS